MNRPDDHGPERPEEKREPPFTSLISEEEKADWRITGQFVLGFVFMLVLLAAVFLLTLNIALDRGNGETEIRLLLLTLPLVVLALLAGRKKWAALGALAALLFALLVAGSCFLGGFH